MSEFPHVQPGLSLEFEYLVEDEHTALHIGSGSAKVLATPWMIAYLERTARTLLGRLLPEGSSSVGVQVEVRHLAPAAAGSRVVARAEILTVEGNQVTFAVQVRDQFETLGVGRHVRVIVDEARFLRRVQAKAVQAGSG